MQELGSFGGANVATAGQAVFLVEGSRCLVQITTRLTVFQPGGGGDGGRELRRGIDVQERGDIVCG